LTFVALVQLIHLWTLSKPDDESTFTTTKEGHIAIQISLQTTKKTVSENPQFRTTIPRKLLSLCKTLNFALVQSQALRNSRNWTHCKTFPIIMSSIHDLWFKIHRKLFATNPTSQRLSELTKKSIGFRYNV
jgi:hypothetical protein